MTQLKSFIRTKQKYIQSEARKNRHWCKINKANKENDKMTKGRVF